MNPNTRFASVVLFGLLTLALGCGSSESSARDGGTDGPIAGGAGGHAPGSGGGGSLGSGQSGGGGAGGLSVGGSSAAGGGLASGGAGAGGAGTGGTRVGGTSAGGDAGSGGRSTAGNTTGGSKSTATGGTTSGGGISGGATSSGGGTSTGGNAGSGGRSTAGNTASSATSAGSGGTSAAGNTSSGGSQTGGSGGSANLDGGADVGPGPDAMADTARPDGPADLAQKMDTGGNNASFDACFADLPAVVGTQMIATKQSSDNRVRIRIALDTEDRMGTSGTYGWGFIRLAVEEDGQVTCIKDRANLKYTGSRHNCTDSATATSGSTKYTLQAPDRSQTQITIEGGAANGTWTLTDSTCSMAGSLALPSGCRSGGSC